jgi:hypothetical protein
VPKLYRKKEGTGRKEKCGLAVSYFFNLRGSDIYLFSKII